MKLIKSFKNGMKLIYDRGNFDDWCIYLIDTKGKKKPPKDVDYFRQLREYANKHGVDCVYGDFVKVYDLTKDRIQKKVLMNITEVSAYYKEDALGMEIILTILYAAMIAEERKEHSILGKRIKRLGIHMLLNEGDTIEHSANFMRGMKWRELDKMCVERGF